MKSVYLATKFTQAIQVQYFNFEFRNTLIKIIDHLIGSGINVKSAHLKEEFGNLKIKPDEFVVRDFNNMKKCNFIIALLDEKFSGGVHIELGWASLQKKPILILIPYSMTIDQLSPMILGLNNFTKCLIKRYYDESHMIKHLDSFLNNYK